MKIDNIIDIDKLIDTPEGLLKTKLAMLTDFEIYLRIMYSIMKAEKPIIKNYHYTIIKKLEERAFGEVETNLCLNLAPGAGKSVLVSFFITWCFARDINLTFMYVSSADDLITQLSGDTKRIIDNEYWKKIFYYKIKRDHRAKDNYSFEGAVLRTGLIGKTMNSLITGLDAGSTIKKSFTGALILDDPFDAGNIRSIVKTEECIRIFQEKLSTRKRGKTITILINQRLFVNDLTAWIEENEKEQWEIVAIPALDENDNVIGLINDYERDKVIRIRNTNPALFYAQYQQTPIKNGGAMFKLDWFCFTDDIPARFDYRFITADIAYKEKQQNDFSVFAYWGVINIEGRNRLYLLDMVRRHINAVDIERWIEPWIKQKLNYGFRDVWIEDKGHGIYLNQSFRNKGYHIPTEERIKETLPRHTDKVERANNILSCIDGIWQNIYINNRIDCLPEFKKELLEFPNSKNDDTIDTFIDAVKIALFEEDIVQKYKRLYG
jgi:predicted phage terminase large subunit-like protein